MKLENCVNPYDVVTPRKNITAIHVIYDGGENSFSLAKLKWKSEETNLIEDKLGLRWNGTKQSPKGFPTAMGNPSWFIVPAKLEQVLKDKAFELNETEGKAKIINIANKIIDHVSHLKKSNHQGQLGFTTYVFDEKVNEQDRQELEKILSQNMIFFLKTDNPEDTFDLGLDGSLTVRLNFLI
ncbi:hypothetical protein [Acinetobacter populi]|uniref:hypothetical protein n=1 Tax=Acinetobacter populi TaxID=1582270 RepID=UPI001FECC746|nr:hypothetical protein [Acinetobacter populi]